MTAGHHELCVLHVSAHLLLKYQHKYVNLSKGVQLLVRNRGQKHSTKIIMVNEISEVTTSLYFTYHIVIHFPGQPHLMLTHTHTHKNLTRKVL